MIPAETLAWFKQNWIIAVILANLLLGVYHQDKAFFITVILFVFFGIVLKVKSVLWTYAYAMAWTLPFISLLR